MNLFVNSLTTVRKIWLQLVKELFSNQLTWTLTATCSTRLQ